MHLQGQTSLIDQPLSDPSPITTQPAPHAMENDPLIDKGGQDAVLFGTALLFLIAVVLIGIFSSRIEHAIIAALILSLILVGLFISVGH